MDSKDSGRLVLSIGETLLSGWEAARLKPGDVVLSYREAGYPGFLLFNNLPVGLGEVVLLKDSLGVKVVDSDFRPSFRVDPGRQEALAQKVPAFIGVGELTVGLAALADWKAGALFDLKVPYRGSAEADLWYGGLRLARGIVVVAGEIMGLRVTERLLDLPEAAVLASGNIAEASQRFKDYDFSRPDRFSSVQIRRLGEIHDLFRRNLEFSLPEAPRAASAVVDQCTWGEALDLVGKHGLEQRLVFGQPQRPGRTAGRSLVFSQSGPGLFASSAPVLAQCLRNGWKKFLDFPLVPETDPEFPNPTDMVIVVLLSEAGASAPFLVVVYPYTTLEPVLNVLGS